MNASAHRIGIVGDEVSVERSEPVRTDLDVVVDIGKVGSPRFAHAGVACVVEALLGLARVADGDGEFPCKSLHRTGRQYTLAR